MIGQEGDGARGSMLVQVAFADVVPVYWCQEAAAREVEIYQTVRDLPLGTKWKLCWAP